LRRANHPKIGRLRGIGKFSGGCGKRSALPVPKYPVSCPSALAAAGMFYAKEQVHRAKFPKKRQLQTFKFANQSVPTPVPFSVKALG
jgi:hypothetical protein